MTGSTLPMSDAEAEAEISAHNYLRVWMAVLPFTAWTATPLWVDVSVLGLVVASHWKVKSFISIRRAAPFYLWSWAIAVAATFFATNFLYPGNAYTLAAFVIVPFVALIMVLWGRLPGQLVAARLAEEGRPSPALQAPAKQGCDDVSPAPVKEPE